jgi:hypothetical protein
MMARPLRVEYAGAVYQVAVRGHARQGDTGITSPLFIMGIDGRGGGGAGAFFLRETRCVPAMKKRRFRGEYRGFCLSHGQEPEGASVGGAFPEAVHARKSREEPGMGGGPQTRRVAFRNPECCAGRPYGRAVAGVRESVGFVRLWAV